MTLTPNCLPEGETLADIARRECAIGFDLRFCRSVAVSEHDRVTETCDPPEAEFASLYALTDLGEAIAIHDADLTSAGADEVAAVARALFVAIVNARRDPPDAAQWTCRVFVPLQVLVYATFRSKATGLFHPNAECLRRGL